MFDLRAINYLPTYLPPIWRR